MLRSLLRAAAVAASQSQANLTKIFLPTTTNQAQLTASRSFATKKSKSNAAQAKKKGSGKKDGSDEKVKPEDVQIIPTEELVAEIEEEHRRSLAQNAACNKAVDMGPNGRPLFTSTPSLSQLTRTDAWRYMEFSKDELERVMPEGIQPGM